MYMTYFLARDEGGRLGTKGLSSSIFIVANVLDSMYCYHGQRQVYAFIVSVTPCILVMVIKVAREDGSELHRKPQKGGKIERGLFLP